MSLSTVDVATNVEQWAIAAVPTLQTYPDDPEDLDRAFPIAIADVQRDRVTEQEGSLSAFEFEQVKLRVWSVRLTVLVAPDPSWVKQQELYGHVDTLGLALRRNDGLGGRVQVAAPTYEAEYPGEVEHSSGTVARAVTMDIIVGEQVP